MLMDFGIFGAAAGIDYPEDLEPAGDDWWLPPRIWDWRTAPGRDDWMMDLRYGGCDRIMQESPSCTPLRG